MTNTAAAQIAATFGVDADALVSLVEWAKSLPGREALTVEAIGSELRRRFDTVPGTVTGEAMVAYGVERLGGTYDEFRSERVA